MTNGRPSWGIRAKPAGADGEWAIYPFKTEALALAWAEFIYRRLTGGSLPYNVKNAREMFTANTQVVATSYSDVWEFAGGPDGQVYMPTTTGSAPGQSGLQKEAMDILVEAAIEGMDAADRTASETAAEKKFTRLQELAQKTGMMGSSGPVISGSLSADPVPEIEAAAGLIAGLIQSAIDDAGSALAANVAEPDVLAQTRRRLAQYGQQVKRYLLQVGVGEYSEAGSLESYFVPIVEAAQRRYQKTIASASGATPAPITLADAQAALTAAVATLTIGRVYVYQLPDGTVTRQGAGIIAPPGSKLLRIENEAQVAYVDSATGRTVYLSPGTTPPPNFVRKENALVGGTAYSPAGIRGVTPRPGLRGGSSGYSPPAGVVIKTPEQLRPAQPATMAGSAFLVLPRAYSRKPPTEFTYALPAGEAARVEKEKFRIPNMGFSPAGSKFNRF